LGNVNYYTSFLDLNDYIFLTIHTAFLDCYLNHHAQRKNNAAEKSLNILAYPCSYQDTNENENYNTKSLRPCQRAFLTSLFYVAATWFHAHLLTIPLFRTCH